MSTKTVVDTATPPKLVAFVGKYAATVAGDVASATFLTPRQAWEEFVTAQQTGALEPSEKEPGEGFSFMRPVEPEGAEGPTLAVEVVPLDDWLWTMARRRFSDTTSTLARVLECLHRL